MNRRAFVKLIGLVALVFPVYAKNKFKLYDNNKIYIQGFPFKKWDEKLNWQEPVFEISYSAQFEPNDTSTTKTGRDFILGSPWQIVEKQMITKGYSNYWVVKRRGDKILLQVLNVSCDTNPDLRPRQYPLVTSIIKT